MDNTVWAVIITGVISVITTLIANSKTQAIMQTEIKAIKEDIERLDGKVEKHNNFGVEIAKIQQEIKDLKETIK